jgi:DNA replicative helicase MCM subunit Mcm2 (Cdc46/Mcm family)
MSIAEKKLSLLERIMKLSYDEEWQQLESVVTEIEAKRKKTLTTEELLKKYVEPITEKIDFKQLEKEQNYPQYDSQKSLAIVTEMNIQEPIEDLLNMI